MPTGGVTKTNIKACRSKHTGVGFVKATVVACDEDDNITAEVSGMSVLDADDRHVEVSSPGNSDDVGPATCDWITTSRCVNVGNTLDLNTNVQQDNFSTGS